MFPRNPVPYSRGKICIFSLMHIKVWQTHLITCTLLRLSHRTCRAHRLIPEHTHCLPVGTNDEEAWVVLFCDLIYQLLHYVRGSSRGEPLGPLHWLPSRSELSPPPHICSSMGLSIMMSFNRVREGNCVALFTKEPKVLVFLHLPLVWTTTLLPRVAREYVTGPIQKNSINGSCTELLALTILSKILAPPWVFLFCFCFCQTRIIPLPYEISK